MSNQRVLLEKALLEISSGDKKELLATLNNAPINIKGNLFENVLSELYSGNGWISVKTGKSNDKGADIVLYSRGDNKPKYVIQAKNHANPISVDLTRSEIIKFEKESSIEYGVNQFKIISVNGFVKRAYDDLSNFNVSLESSEYLFELIDGYNEKKKNNNVKIDLNPHNNWAWKQGMAFSKRNENFAFIQATGTGKSFLSAKCIESNKGKRILYMSPTTIIFDQFNKKFPFFSGLYDTITYAQCSINHQMKKIPPDDYDLIILDEFHRLGSEYWGKGIRNLIQSNCSALVIGLSATPIRYLDHNKDMVKELFHGKAVYGPDLFEGIVRKILPVPKYITGFYNLENEIYKSRKQILSSLEMSVENKLASLGKIENSLTEWKEKSYPGILIDEAFESLDGKYLVFCEDIQHINEMEEKVRSWFKFALQRRGNTNANINTYATHSGKTGSENGKVFHQFSKSKGTINILFSVNKLNEGLHLKGTKSVFLLRKTMSPIIYYQQIGRCLSSGETDIVPVIFDLVNNKESISKKSLKEGLIKALSSENKRRKKAGLEENIVLDWDVDDYGSEWINSLKEISFNISSWSFFFSKLEKHWLETGNCDLPQRDSRIGKWSSRQRADYKNGSLEEKKIKLLNSISFSWDVNDSIWRKNFEHLLLIIKENRNCPYKSNIKEIDEWMNTQRRYFREGKIRKDRLDKLNSIGFIWSISEISWNKKFSELCEYYKENNTSSVPRTQGSLGRWVAKQREAERTMPEHRIKKLNSLNFTWRK